MNAPTVLITGSGIGIGAARAFATAGYRVIGTHVLEDEGRAVADEIESDSGDAE